MFTLDACKMVGYDAPFESNNNSNNFNNNNNNNASAVNSSNNLLPFQQQQHQQQVGFQVYATLSQQQAFHTANNNNNRPQFGTPNSILHERLMNRVQTGKFRTPLGILQERLGGPNCTGNAPPKISPIIAAVGNSVSVPPPTFTVITMDLPQPSGSNRFEHLKGTGLSEKELQEIGGLTETEKKILWTRSNLSNNNPKLQALLSFGDPCKDDNNFHVPSEPSPLSVMLNLPNGEVLRRLQQEARTRREKERLAAEEYRVNIMNKLEPSSKVNLFILNSVLALTLRRYHSRVHQVIQAGYPISLYGLAGFLATNPRVFSHKSLDGWSCAINLFSAYVDREVTPAEMSFWARFRKGLKRATPEGVARVKGAVTRDLVIEMLKWGSEVTNKKTGKTRMPANLREGLMLQHAAGLRTSEIELVRNTNTRFDKDRQCYIIGFQKQKDGHAVERGEVLMEYHHTDPYWNDEIKKLVERIEKAGVPDATLVSDWDSFEANNWVKSAQKHFGWDKNLFWSNHGLRHGSAVDAAVDARAKFGPEVTAAQIDNAIFERTGHLTESMRRMYAEDVFRRKAKGIALNFLLKKQSNIHSANNYFRLKWNKMVKENLVEANDELDEALEGDWRDQLVLGRLDKDFDEKASSKAKVRGREEEDGGKIEFTNDAESDTEEEDEEEDKTPAKRPSNARPAKKARKKVLKKGQAKKKVAKKAAPRKETKKKAAGRKQRAKGTRKRK